jgi:BON domain/Uncharacterised nucleotidyltransferase
MTVSQDRHRKLEEVLIRAVDALERARIPYALMGGLASASVGRARHTHDIDLFVTPAAAGPALDALDRAAFRTERTDPAWLYKAFWGDAMVDVIFTSKGGIVFDEDMAEHAVTIDVLGRPVRVLAAEDQVVIKALANSEHAPRHWHDALAILASAELDCAYLVRRARPHPDRVLSLLLYARSQGIEVPSHVLLEMLESVATSMATTEEGGAHCREDEADDQLAARLREALATDPRIGELHLSVSVTGGEVAVEGKVASAARKEMVERVLRELAPGRRIDSRVEALE